MRYALLAVLAATVAPLLGGCAELAPKYPPAETGVALTRALGLAEAAAGRSPGLTPAAAAQPGKEAGPADWGVRAAEMVQARVIIYSAGYRVAVADVQAALAEAEKLAEELGGYVQAATTEQITIRVPADKFRVASGRIERQGVLLSREVRAADVTEEYVDLRMRLAASQAMLERLKALLAKAADAKDALEVEREIARVMSEIERLQGRIRLLETQAALSTITVRYERLTEAPRPAILGRRLPFDWLGSLGISPLLDY